MVSDRRVAVTDSLVTIYDSADESSVCSTSLPPLKKLDGVESIYGPKTIKSILRSKSTFKAEALKGVIINEPSSALAKGNKSSSASKVHSAPAGKLKSVKIKDDPPFAIVMKDLNNLKLQVSKNRSSYSRSNQSQQKTDHRTCDHVEYISTINMSQHLKSLGRASSRSKIPRPSKCFFLPCTHVLYYHLSNNVYTIQYWIMWKLRPLHKWSNRIISLKREIFQEDPYNMHSKDVKFVVVQLIPQLITMILNSSKEVKYFKPKSVTSGIPTGHLLLKNRASLPKLLKISTGFGHKRLAHLNFKIINKQAKQNLVIGLPHVSYSKTTCYIHNHKDHLGKFDENSDDGYLLGYSLVSKAFRVFNTRRQQTEETYHITFDESPDAIKFSKP
ncbi:retrovirus-related pol polyprotein from transposon TNT 1-94 [Tanacetum coccineum]